MRKLFVNSGKSEEKQPDYSKLEPYIRALSTNDGFLDLFYKLCSEYSTPELAYDAVERICLENFGQRRYTNYHCFKNVRNAKIRGKK